MSSLFIFFAYLLSFFFFNDTATTEIYTLSLHDALPIYRDAVDVKSLGSNILFVGPLHGSECNPSLLEIDEVFQFGERSEEHTSELQSRGHLVCRLLLEKKKKKKKN